MTKTGKAGRPEKPTTKLYPYLGGCGGRVYFDLPAPTASEAKQDVAELFANDPEVNGLSSKRKLAVIKTLSWAVRQPSNTDSYSTEAAVIVINGISEGRQWKAILDDLEELAGVNKHGKKTVLQPTG